MIWIAICLIAGAVMLYFGSEWLVRGAKGLALNLGVAPFVIGLTVLAFGSSAPEAITSIVSTSNPQIIIGNVVGSNIANVGLAIGLAAVLGPMAAIYKDMKLEIWVMLLASVLLCCLGLIGSVGYIVGIPLILSLFVFVYVVFKKKKADKEGRAVYEEEVTIDTLRTPVLTLLCVVGLVLLYFGAKYFIEGAKGLAQILGASDLIIGLVVVAIGTSLPEICISLLAARRGEADLAVANIVGSNIFNILFVFGIGASLVDIPISQSMVGFHMPMMLLLSITMFLIVRFKNRIDRRSGFVLLGIYAVYFIAIALNPSLMS
ncbi:MAG: calcium/sodium antiporter [Candidatus Methanomethylophilaceae archaeon]|nr:calcium/sodium antiporter [Candidatus Methanomethylophilaceae archaeon]